MSEQLAETHTSMSEAQVKQLIKDLANTFGHPIRSPILHTPDEYGLEYKNVSFPSMDGVPLEAWFMPADSDKLVIANHPLWFNRYGFPAHLEPWKQIGAGRHDGRADLRAPQRCRAQRRPGRRASLRMRVQ